ncbi:hypothetical protein [Helicobacter bilis]|uniref:hypothetical protein n=1 Tax=Helicobacter bilis TaxID=37372 RepID=UPI000A5EB2C8|nr:hypothetical protein [Helicobacter bilis]
MKVVIKRALRVLLGEKRATHLFFMTRRGIRNLEITKFVIKIAYGKYIGGQTLCKNQSPQQPQHDNQTQHDTESHKIIYNILHNKQKMAAKSAINHSHTTPLDNNPDNEPNDKQTSIKDTPNPENNKHIKPNATKK